jgi:hypothetical protein
MLPNGILIDERTRSELGEASLNELLAACGHVTAKPVARALEKSRLPYWSMRWDHW